MSCKGDWMNTNSQIHFSLGHILYSLLFAAGMAALWILRQPLGDFLNWIGDRQAVITSIQQFGAWGPVVLFLLLILQVFLAVIPGHALMIAGGFVFGFRVGLLIALSSTVLGSQIAFLIARNLGRPVVDRLASPEAIRRWERLAARQGPLFFFFSFVLPFFPSDLMCYVAGLGMISAFRFFIANFLGRLVVAAPLAFIGSRSLQMPVALWIAGFIFWAALFGSWYFYAYRRAQSSRLVPERSSTEGRIP
jgi:uncharacterized membrane protein YdjX (TVP38/TMEM64 family)